MVTIEWLVSNLAAPTCLSNFGGRSTCEEEGHRGREQEIDTKRYRGNTSDAKTKSNHDAKPDSEAPAFVLPINFGN